MLEGAERAWSSSLLPSLLRLRTEGLTTDTHLVTVGDQGPCNAPLLAHSLVLAAASPTLAQILATSSDNEEITLILPGVEREEMEEVLEDIYLGKDRARVFLQQWGLWEEKGTHKRREEVIFKKETIEPGSVLEKVQKDESNDSWEHFNAEDSVDISDDCNNFESVGMSQGKRYKTCLEPECSKQFASRQEFLKHSKDEHNICDAKDRILIRNRLITPLPSGKLLCPDCPKEFINKSKLADHLRRHDMKSSTCEQCGKNIKIKNMKGHLETHTMPGETLSCNKCDYSTPHERMFKYHMQTHSGIKYTCDECGKSFNHRNTVIAHKADQHSGKLYMCDECDFTCKGHRHRLETHKLMKHGSTSASIIEFEEQHTKALLNHKLVTTHKKSTGKLGRDQDGVRFTCCEEGCTFSSNHKQSLKLHTNSKHLGIKYKCDICDYTSGQLSNVKKHTIVKHNAFSCAMCSFKCLDSEKMQSHVSQVH